MNAVTICKQQFRGFYAILQRMLAVGIRRNDPCRIILPLQDKGESRFERDTLSSVPIMAKNRAKRPLFQFPENPAARFA
jgi:hypothetical protein